MERDVAIVGMACVFPKAPDLPTFWRNICDGVDAITDVPASRWDPLYYDPSSSAPDRVYARRGGFIDEYAQFDPAKFGIMPSAAKETEPEQLLTLQVAADALADAGYADREFARDRTSVVVGRGHYFGPRMVRMLDVTRGTQHVIESLRRLLPGLTDEQLAAIKKDFQAHCGVYGADTAIGLVPNLLASRVANRLDLGGSAYTLDAACASTLVAVDLACRELRDGKADLSLAGGVHLCHDVAFWSVFSQLGALSRSQQIRPFDRHADGLLIGEGIGMFVLKRLSDAQRDDDRIYAVIRGTGTSSDGRDTGLMAPRVEGQVMALERAWQDAGLPPSSVGLVEAHGTATTLGDAAELTTLARVFGPNPRNGERIPLGSVKSMIGHAMPAAGAAGLIKAAMAVYEGVRPPTLHCDDPHPLLESTRFRAIGAAEPWDDDARRAAVNAFGFGGINVHVIVDAPKIRRRVSRGARPKSEEPSALVLAAPTQAALLEALREGRQGGEGPWRLALFAPSAKRIATAAAAIEAGRPRHGRDGIYFSAHGALADGGKLAFVFPGVEAHFAPEIDDVARHFGLPVPDLRAPDLEHQGIQVFLLNAFLERVMELLDVTPDMIAGHSIGEWSGMMAAGMFEDTSLEEFLAALQPGSLRVADMTYVAVGAGADRLVTLIGDLPDVAISHDNCLHQAIVCAPEAAVARLLPRLREARVLHEVLPFRSGFHSPAVAGLREHYAQLLARLVLRDATIPLWSATTCTPYPSDPKAIGALFLDHLTQPVRFRELLCAMHDAGARVFVQVGTGSLTAFIDDALSGRSHHAVSLIAPQRPGLEQLRRACAALYVEGANLDLARLGLSAPAPRTRSRSSLSLELGAPLVRLDLEPLSVGAPARAEAMPSDPVHAAFEISMRELAAAQVSVLRAFSSSQLATSAPLAARPDERTDRVEISLRTFPELIDHSLLPQPKGWRPHGDWAPAVPMTMSIALLMDAAQRLDPGRTPIAVEDVLASAWLYVEPPLTVTVASTRIDADKIRVKIDGYVEGTVTMADRYPEPPPPSTEPLVETRDYDIAMERIYPDGWLFHGPRYQGVLELRDRGTNGMRATLEALPAKGALLDAAGQVYGLWIVSAVDTDRLAMPVRVRRVDFYSPEPAPGSKIECTVWVRELKRREVRADLELVHGDRVYARVTGWEDWRFETGGGIYELIRQPAKYYLATFDAHGCSVMADPGWRSVTIDFLARRFLSSVELQDFGGIRRVQRQRDWLCGRIAAKDAIRHLVRERFGIELFPIEVAIASDAVGRPRVTIASHHDVRVSIAHKDGIGCAIAAEGVDPGIDIEKIESRSAEFAALAFGPDEIELLRANDRDEWLTRFWAAKEAAGKAAGTGLSGNPKRLTVTAVAQERVQVDGRWVTTRKVGEYIIASTVQ